MRFIINVAERKNGTDRESACLGSTRAATEDSGYIASFRQTSSSAVRQSRVPETAWLRFRVQLRLLSTTRTG